MFFGVRSGKTVSGVIGGPACAEAAVGEGCTGGGRSVSDIIGFFVC